MRLPFRTPIRNSMWLFATGVLALFAHFGCATGAPDQGFAGPDPGEGVPDSPSDQDGLGTGDVLTLDDAAALKLVLFYGHNDSTLFRLDPEDPILGLSGVGKFECVGPEGEPSMTDPAVDKDGKLYGVSAAVIFLDSRPGSGVVHPIQGKVRCDQRLPRSQRLHRCAGVTTLAPVVAPPPKWTANENSR